MSKDKAEEKCCAGCKMYYGGEIRHHKDCIFYTESLTSIYDKMDTENAQLREALGEIIKMCEEWVVPGAENSNNCENNHYVEIDDLKSLITKAKTLIE